jgi:hypothetical protein
VIRFLLALSIVAPFVGCASVERRAFAFCPPANDGAWQFLGTPPAGAEEMLAIAKPEPAKLYSFQRIRLYWFGNDVGHFMLCRTPLDYWGGPGCGSNTWEFHREGDRWVESSGLEHIVVCG